MITTMIHDSGDRLRSFEMVADLAGGGPARPPVPLESRPSA